MRKDNYFRLARKILYCNIFDMKKKGGSNSTIFRLSLYFFLLGGALLFASRFMKTEALVIMARDLQFGRSLLSWQYNEIVTKIAFFKDAMWFCGLLLLVLGFLLLYERPAGLIRFFEETAQSPPRAILFVFLFIQIAVCSMFLVTELRLLWNKMYDYSPPGGKEQRMILCGREYQDASNIRDRFLPGEKVLLAGRQLDPIFLNYYLYPVRLYLYDDRPISPVEINRSYVKLWLKRKRIQYV